MTTIPKDTPRQLAAVIKKHDGKYHHIADELGINAAHVHRYITQGIEPKSNRLRKLMFLPVRKSRAGQQIPAFMKTWRKLPTSLRNNLIMESLRRIGKL